MAVLQNKWALATIAVLCWAVIASSAFGYYYYQYTDLVDRIGGTPSSINLAIDYGNGTRRWFNDTTEATLYDAMLHAGWDVEVEHFGGMGVYVKSINDVKEAADGTQSWSWWTWTQFGWAHGGSAWDKYVVSPDETIICYYSQVNQTTWEMSPPP
ncbi:MAG: hypothetical protein ACOC6G_01910 [Thermoproteota archaeon]